MDPLEPKSLSGRVALVTGGNRGLGKAIALSLGSAGASLALVARCVVDAPRPPAAILAMGEVADWAERVSTC
jgi:NAD(P)-dependent dehydrogenase (short-subunit alcohol dehydrogenase family)